MSNPVVEWAVTDIARSCRLVASLGVPYADAEDVVNDAIVQVLLHPGSAYTNPRGYWIAAVRNTARNWVRHHQRSIVSSDVVRITLTDQPVQWGNPEEEAEADDLWKRFKQMRGLLPKRQREAVDKAMKGQRLNGAGKTALCYAKRKLRVLV